MAPLTNWPLGRPLPVNGLKFLVNAGSPAPVMTRHGWPASGAALVATPLGRAAATVTTTNAARTTAAMLVIASSDARVERGD